MQINMEIIKISHKTGLISTFCPEGNRKYYPVFKKIWLLQSIRSDERILKVIEECTALRIIFSLQSIRSDERILKVFSLSQFTAKLPQLQSIRSDERILKVYWAATNVS